MQAHVVVTALLAATLTFGSSVASDATVIEYTSPLGGSGSYCPTFGNFAGAVSILVRGTSDVTGVAVPDPWSHCGDIPSDTTSLTIRVADDVSDQVLVTVSQLDANNEGSYARFCGSGTWAIDPASVVYSVHLLPYGQTSGECPTAEPPTHGFVSLDWA